MEKRRLVVAAVFLCSLLHARATETSAGRNFHEKVEPILKVYCFDCHGDGMSKGGVSFDGFKSDGALVEDRNLWFAVLKNVRAGIMPPAKKARPSPEEQKKLEEWIKFDDFGIDAKHPDPGRVTIRRLNRFEYRNTIRDLMGIDFDAQTELPADDAGYGFDNIGDVLTLSPMLLEKYMDAANSIVTKAVPVSSQVPEEKIIPGRAFEGFDEPAGPSHRDLLHLYYNQAATVSNSFKAEYPGHYQLLLDLTANEKYVEDQFDYNKCALIFKVDGVKMLQQDFIREGGKPFHFEFERNWKPGEHVLTLEVQPLTPKAKQVRMLSLRINSVTVRGPLEGGHGIIPRNYTRFFPKRVPMKANERRAYAHELLGAFAEKSFRHPVEDDTPDRLTALAEKIWNEPGKTFEAGVAQAMTAVLVSPRFLFREENAETAMAKGQQPLVDEYALASRLSYFLWSTMPDEELLRLAGEQKLRLKLAEQVKRMLADPKSEALMQNFPGQWLQARDIETVPIEGAAILARERKADPEVERLRKRFRELAKRPFDTLSQAEKDELDTVRKEFFKRVDPPGVSLSRETRNFMRQEVEMYFANIVRQDRSVLELVDSDYDFLNERLARQYGLTNLSVRGMELRRVKLPPDCPRGGVITMGGVLAITSNPTRTSPVKRGLFILQNILGNPTPPPPPNIPPLEEVSRESGTHQPTSREALEIHRNQPVCNACHGRMDPLGLALENFNAMGMWRETEFEQTIDASGQLITGESFKHIRELKHLLATNHHVEFYRTLTEKMLTYALGRGLEYYDVETVDKIVDRLEHENGRFSVLLSGVIESAPFQRRREAGSLAESAPLPAGQQRAEIKRKP